MNNQKDEIKLDDVHRLLEYACRNTYKAKDTDARVCNVTEICELKSVKSQKTVNVRP